MMMDTFELIFVGFKRLLSVLSFPEMLMNIITCAFSQKETVEQNKKIELINLLFYNLKLHDKVKNLPSPPAVISASEATVSTVLYMLFLFLPY